MAGKRAGSLCRYVQLRLEYFGLCRVAGIALVGFRSESGCRFVQGILCAVCLVLQLLDAWAAGLTSGAFAFQCQDQDGKEPYSDRGG